MLRERERERVLQGCNENIYVVDYLRSCMTFIDVRCNIFLQIVLALGISNSFSSMIYSTPSISQGEKYHTQQQQRLNLLTDKEHFSGEPEGNIPLSYINNLKQM